MRGSPYGGGNELDLHFLGFPQRSYGLADLERHISVSGCAACIMQARATESRSARESQWLEGRRTCMQTPRPIRVDVGDQSGTPCPVTTSGHVGIGTQAIHLASMCSMVELATCAFTFLRLAHGTAEPKTPVDGACGSVTFRSIKHVPEHYFSQKMN